MSRDADPGPAAPRITFGPGRNNLKGAVPQFQKIVEECCAENGLGTMIVPLKMSQAPPRGLCLVRFPLNGVNEPVFASVSVGDIFSGKIVCRLRDALPTQIEYPGRGKVHQQRVKQGTCFLVDGILLAPPFGKQVHEVLQAFVFDDVMPQRRYVPVPAVRPVARTGQGLEPAQVFAFLLRAKTRQERPQHPGWIVALDVRQCLVEFKRIDVTAGADRYQSPFVQVRDDGMLTVRQGGQGRRIGVIRFQVA